MKKHYSNSEWIAFLEGNVSETQKEAMQLYLKENPSFITSLKGLLKLKEEAGEEDFETFLKEKNDALIKKLFPFKVTK